MKIPAADLAEQLAALGHARAPRFVSAADCARLAALWSRDECFRSTVDMARHRFGEGGYKYFAYPLPPLVAKLRETLYPVLAEIANGMAEALRRDERYPPRLADWLAICHAGGQRRPTPLLLRYEAGGWNALHRDLYGPLVFPLQATILLSRPGEDFEGGEFLLVEQRPRQQSVGAAVALQQGELIVFPVRDRPVAGARGAYRAQMRHGVSRVLRGERFTLGLIFHDAA
jgi:uncharacterized protein